MEERLSRAAWYDYQEQVANLFRETGLEADTNVRVQGVRSTHDVDVLVKGRAGGLTFTWFVECKLWRERVSKLHVLAFRQIVTDTGVERGILLSESGFQSGAIDAATKTNIQLSSIAELGELATEEVGNARLREIHLRVDECLKRYWDLEKEVRIAFRLRPPLASPGFSTVQTLEVVRYALGQHAGGKYPIVFDDAPPTVYLQYRYVDIDIKASTSIELANKLDPIVTEIEERLRRAELGSSSDNH
ncbi:restriction endonuclease [Labedaea rhizosphaerae]|nr:restriction endonuclease [Labedaea rhizosphaerae]